MQPLADGFVTDRNQPEATYPLAVAGCRRCGFAQLTVAVNPEVLYQRDYPYEASVTPGGRVHFADLAARAVERFGIQGGLAVDIGCNDGVLLQGLQDAGCRVIGVDPAEQIVQLARNRGFTVFGGLFEERAVNWILDQGQGERASLITATNVFAHIDAVHSFMEQCGELLTPNGVLIIEAPHFQRLLEHAEYDTIYHEHLSYLTVSPLIPFFEAHGFELFDVQQTGIHGGSIRLFVGRPGQHSIERRNLDAVIQDEVYGQDLHGFARQVQTNRDELHSLIRELAAMGGKIAGISAPAKGMTLINSTGIGQYMAFLTEKSTQKIGKYAPGSRLEVRTDEALVNEGVTHGLILAWNFGAEIAERQEAFRMAGGKFLIPIPHPRLLAGVA